MQSALAFAAAKEERDVESTETRCMDRTRSFPCAQHCQIIFFSLEGQRERKTQRREGVTYVLRHRQSGIRGSQFKN